jgi:Na+/H+ antiporter NhaB
MQLQASFAFAVTQVSLSWAIADALGQKTIEMARHYAKGADLKRKMRGVVTEWDAEVNRRRTKVVRPDR